MNKVDEEVEWKSKHEETKCLLKQFNISVWSYTGTVLFITQAGRSRVPLFTDVVHDFLALAHAMFLSRVRVER